MSGIYISYRREDTGPYAGRLSDALGARLGHEVVRDTHDLALGEDSVQSIRRAVATCDALVAVIGRRWVDLRGDDGLRRLDDASDHVRVELDTAMSSGLTVIPVLVETARLPSAADLPESLVGLSTRNALRVTDDDWDDQVEQLLAALQAKLDPRTASPSARPPVTPLETDSHEDEGDKSFWKTVPGILSGVAALLTALTGLFVALQATRGGGDGEKRSNGDAAKAPPASVLPVRIADLSVPGDRTWTDTGIDVQPPDVMTVSASGTVIAATDQNPQLKVVPAGINAPSLVPYSVIKEANHAGLIARIGAAGPPFFVGAGGAYPVSTSGRVFFGVNDTATFNNAGLFDVRVEVRAR